MAEMDSPGQDARVWWLQTRGENTGRRGLLSERVAYRIERFIADHRLQPGDRLPSGRELTKSFGVSRTVIRDAIAALEQRGLIESRPGSGIYVTDGGSDAVAGVLGQMLRQDAISLPELMEARQLLEVHGTAIAARRAKSDDVSQMAEAIVAMQASNGPTSFVEADVAFHEAIAQAVGNRVVAALLKSLRPLLLQGMLIGTGVSGAREMAIQEHQAILDAVAAHDEARARNLMSSHLRRSYGEWMQAGRVGPSDPIPEEIDRFGS